MPALKSLTFTVLPPAMIDPVLERRARVVARLEEQKKLVIDPTYRRSVQSTVLQDGVKTTVTKEQLVHPWWRQTATGNYALCIKSGTKPLEFERGKTAVAVANLDRLPAVLDALIEAVRAGELDQQLAVATKPAGVKGAKKSR